MPSIYKLRYKTTLLFTLLLILLNCSQGAAKGFYSYNKIDQRESLSSNKVTSIAKDKLGVYWVGTRRGLNYIIDGRVVQLNDDNFVNREIKLIYVDNDSQLWVATDAALFLFDSTLHKFICVDNNYTSAVGIASSSLGTVICRRNAIEIYSHDTKKTTALDVKGVENMEYSSMTPLDSENVILTSAKSRDIYRLNLTSGELDIYEDIKLPPSSSNYRDRLFVDSAGRLWISIYNHSLVRYSLEGEGVKQAEFSSKIGNLSHDLVLDMIEHKGELLIATDGGGINSIDLERDKSQRSTKVFDYQHLPYSESVYTLAVDNNGELLLGTIRNGLITIRNTDIQAFEFNERQVSAHIATLGFCQGDGDNIWIATDGGGVWNFNTLTHKIHQISSTKGLKVTDICNIDRDNLLIAIYGDGIYRLNTHSGAMTRITMVDKNVDKAIADKDIVVSFTEASDSKILILADNIYQYDINKSKVSRVNSTPKFATGNLFSTQQSSTEQFVHNQYAVYQVDIDSGKSWQVYSSSTGGITASRSIGRSIWVIRNYSLYRYDIDKQQEQMILPEFSGQILNFEADNHGTLWLATFNKLIALDTTDPDKYKLFDIANGYASDEYLAHSVLLSREGDIYFGGNNSFVVIANDTKLDIEEPTQIELLNIKVDGTTVQTTVEEDIIAEVTVPWDYNSIDIEVYIPDNNINRSNKFKYDIESHGKISTVESDNRLSIRMSTNGRHHITASYLNNDGTWSSPTHVADVVITPPWWSSTLFISLVILLIIGFIIFLIVIYNRNRVKELQREQLEHEKELSNNKIKFLINISHELRTPLTLIYAPLKRLLERSQFEEGTKRTLVNIFSQSRYMAELINMVLDARRMEAGYGEIEITENNLNEWVRVIVEEFREESAQHKINLSTELDSNITMLNFDAPKCRTVLSNLLMNALRYSRRDGSGEIKVTTMLQDGRVRLSVIDNGVGLAGVNIDSLFNRFMRVNNQTTGSGIGLSYSKAIIEQHPGGVIGAYCNNLNGATFFFELPMGLKCQSKNIAPMPYLSNMIETEEKSSELTNSDYPLAQYTILVVDDQPELVEFLRDSFTPIFKKVYTATNGAEAYQSIKSNKPSIMVSDVMMPEVDGFELCNMVKNDIEISHTPIVLLTAKADSLSKMQGYKSGADAYISKPFELQHLLSLIGSQLRSREITRNYYSKSTAAINVEEVTYSNADEKFMLKLNAFIEENLGNSIDVDGIAKHMCMSRAALYKKIKTIIDIGAMEYVTKIRMTTAAELLRISDRPITEIAMECGYSDNQYFSKAFKQFFGQAPSQYRKENRQR